MDKTKTDYVPNNTYIKLREAYETVLADKQVLEESVGIVDRSLKETNQALKEKEDELHGMKRKIKESEKDFLAASLRGERSERDTEALKEEVDRAAKVIHAHEERIVALERRRACCHTGSLLKFDASRRDAALQSPVLRRKRGSILSEIHGAIPCVYAGRASSQHIKP